MDNKNKKSLKEELSIIFKGYRVLAKATKKPVFTSIIISSLFIATAPFINIYFSALILNELIGDKNKDKLIQLVLLTIGINLIVLLLKSLLSRWKNYCHSNMNFEFLNIYSDKLLAMDFADIEDVKIKKEVDAIKNYQLGMGFGFRNLIQNFQPFVESAIQITLATTIAISLFFTKIPEGSPYKYLDSNIAVIFFIVVLLLSVFLSGYFKIVGGRIFKKANEINTKGNKLFSFYYMEISDVNKGKDIRMYDMKDVLNDRFNSLENWIAFTKYNSSWCALANVISNLSISLIYLYIAMKAYAGAFEVGNIVLYVGAVTQLINGLSGIINTTGILMNNNPFLERVLKFLDIPNKKYQGTLSVEKREDNEYQIEFKNVSFKYPNTDEYVLKNINMKLEIGKKVAIVGMNGSGKTTMIKLLCRLYDVEEGVITLNGIDIKKYDYDEYMSIFSVVFQDFSLLGVELGQNIATSVDVDEKKAWSCLEKSGFTEGENSKNYNLETYISKDFEEQGVKVSGGEAQKIALARALYKNSPFVILDEPTSALDPMAEFEIYSRFNEIVGDKTAIYISHRLSSCRFCDDIIVFDSGELIQRGKHEELIMNEKSKYFELWNAQAQYYK